jgi:hypothetical protein
MKNHFFYSYVGNKREEVEHIYNLLDLNNINTIVEPFCECVAGHFCGRESNCQILCRSLELLVWCFQTQSTSFFVFFCGVNDSVRKKLETWLREKSRVFPLRILGFPQES